MPGPTAEDRAARAGAVSSLQTSLLGLLHPDGAPITLADCTARYREVCADNFARSRRLKEIEQSAAPDRFEHAELREAAQMGNLMARIWGSMAELLRVIEEGDAE